jgi:ubiquitin-protein ligase
MSTDHIGESSEAYVLIVERLVEKKSRASKQFQKTQDRSLPSAILSNKKIDIRNWNAGIAESSEVVNEDVVFHFTTRRED